MTGSMWNQGRVPYCSAGIIFPSLPLGDACGHHLPALLDSEGPSVELFILPGQDQNYLLSERIYDGQQVLNFTDTLTRPILFNTHDPVLEWILLSQLCK